MVLSSCGERSEEGAHSMRWKTLSVENSVATQEGVCSVCGAKPEFLTDWLPDEFYQEAEHGGTVTAVGYSYDGRCDTGSWVNVTEIAAGGYYSIGLKDDGTLYAVGDNEENQCDVGSWDIK